MTVARLDRSADRPERPNVVVFFTDQQRWDSVGLHGNPLGLTPTFDRLAARGTHLANTFAAQPVCGPSRACMQTGRYASQTGCFRNGVPLPAEQPTLAHRFAAAGYATGYIGKWHLAPDDVAGPVPLERRGGYEHWLAANLLEFTSDAYDTVVFDGEGRRTKLPGYRVDALTDAAIRFVADHRGSERDDPFFLFLSHLEPHHQNGVDAYPAPSGVEARTRGRWTPPDLEALGGSAPRHLAGYWGMVARLDAALGRLVDALQSLDLLDSTVLLFASDHGCHFRTRNAEYKRSPHDASLRVPAFLTGPGFTGGGWRERLVSLVDLPPTLLDAAGIEPPAEMAGRSLLAPPAGRDEIYFEISESAVGRGIRTPRWKYAVEAPDADPFTDPRAARYVESHLYDLAHDPYELKNLVGYPSHAELRTELRGRLLARIEAVESERPRIDPAPPVDPGYFDQRRAPDGADG